MHPGRRMTKEEGMRLDALTVLGKEQPAQQPRVDDSVDRKSSMTAEDPMGFKGSGQLAQRTLASRRTGEILGTLVALSPQAAC
eukprot:11990506-Alexandrium_andersonii.AAC.1